MNGSQLCQNCFYKGESSYFSTTGLPPTGLGITVKKIFWKVPKVTFKYINIILSSQNRKALPRKHLIILFSYKFSIDWSVIKSLLPWFRESVNVIAKTLIIITTIKVLITKDACKRP